MTELILLKDTVKSKAGEKVELLGEIPTSSGFLRYYQTESGENFSSKEVGNNLYEWFERREIKISDLILNSDSSKLTLTNFNKDKEALLKLRGNITKYGYGCGFYLTPVNVFAMRDYLTSILKESNYE